MWQVDLRSVSGDPISRVRTQRAAAADPARRGRNILPIFGNIHHYHIVHPPVATIAYFMDGLQHFQQLTVSRPWHKGEARLCTCGQAPRRDVRDCWRRRSADPGPRKQWFHTRHLLTKRATTALSGSPSAGCRSRRWSAGSVAGLPAAVEQMRFCLGRSENDTLKDVSETSASVQGQYTTPR